MNARSKSNPKLKPKRPFVMPNYPTAAPGARGDPDTWRDALRERMGLDEARRVVGSNTPLGILGLPESTRDWRTIQAAYRRLAKQHHPDLGGDPALFRRLQAAYELLEDRFH